MRDDLTALDESRDTAAIAASVIAVVLAKLYWISRIGFENPVLPVTWTLGLSLFLILVPHAVSRMLRQRHRTGWYTSSGVIGIACIAVTAAFGMMADATGVTAIWLFAVAGVGLAIVTFVQWLRRGSLGKSILFIVCLSVFAVWCAGVIWGSRYKMPLFWETMAYKANIHHDTFYYASIANMIDTYGVPSTGLDGVPLIRYHYGSAWLFDQWAHLLGMDVLTFYSLGYSLIVLPLFFSALLQFAAELGARLRNDWRAWIVFTAATVGFIPTVALNSLAVWNSNAFISESYLMGMPVFFMTLAAGLAFSRDVKAGRSRVGFYLLFVPALIAALGFLKISLLILAFAMGGYLVIRKSLYRQPLVLASGAITALAAAYTYHLVSLPAQNGGISPLHFMRYDARQGWQQFFPLIHFLWTWVYIAVRLWEERVSDVSMLRAALRERRLIDAEVLLVVAVLGFLPGEIVSIHGGSAVYFSDVQRWLAVSMLMGRVLFGTQNSELRSQNSEIGSAGSAVGQPTVNSSRTPEIGVRSSEFRVRTLRLSTILMVFLAAPFVASFFINLVQAPLRVLRANMTTRQELAATPREATYYPIVTALREIAKLPESERRESLLFIPQSNHQYWSMFTSDGRCTFTPLIAPGIASVAMLDGMPGAGCEITDQYNMTLYKRRTGPQLPRDTNTEALCERTIAKGFKYLIVLEAPGNEIPRRKRLDCYLQKS